MGLRELSLDEMLDSLGSPQNREMAQSWLERGDKIAVYESRSLGQENRRCVSYGPKGTIRKKTPPEIMPDIFGRQYPTYRLVGVFTGTTVYAAQVLNFADIQRCPHMIIRASHYRADKSCRCSDATDTEMADHNYTWSVERNRWV